MNEIMNEEKWVQLLLKCNAKCVTIDLKENNEMGKKATLNLRVSPEVKQNAEAVLSQLGISMSTAVDMYLRQIYMVGGIPFPVQVKRAPERVNSEMMSASEIREKIQRGLNDVEAGRVRDIKDIARK